jgi:hypothetical protein
LKGKNVEEEKSERKVIVGGLHKHQGSDRSGPGMPRIPPSHRKLEAEHLGDDHREDERLNEESYPGTLTTTCNACERRGES